MIFVKKCSVVVAVLLVDENERCLQAASPASLPPKPRQSGKS
jgi:hypothetical protein